MKNVTQTIDVVMANLNEVLDKFAKENGLKSITTGNIRYDNEGFKTPLEVKFELGEEKEEEIFERKAMIMGLQEGLYMKEVDSNGTKFIIVDINTNAPKNSIVAEKKGTGQQYRMNASRFKK